MDVEEHAEARRRTVHARIRGQSAKGRAVALREWLQLAGDPKDAGRVVASRSERAVRIHQRPGGRLPRTRRPRDLGGYQKERADRRVSEPRARLAAERRTRAR